MKQYKLAELAELVHGELVGESDLEIVGLADLLQAGPQELAFAMERVWLERIPQSSARAIVVSKMADHLPPDRSYVRVEHPRQAMICLLQAFDSTIPPPPGQHAQAVVAPTARIGEGVSIGPFVVVEDGASIGAGTIIWPGTYIGTGAAIGKGCKLYANVSVRENCIIGNDCIIHSGAVIGSDGYGFVQVDKKHIKIPQIGIVVIGDRVEIGANVTIDRATMGETRIGSGTKIDNLAQIAHNVELGEDCLVVAQVGIAGSTRLGQRVTLAGQSGVGGHLVIGDDVVVSGQSAVTKNTATGQTVTGSPARPHREVLHLQAHYQRLPKLVADVESLRQRLADLERRLNGGHVTTADSSTAPEQWVPAKDIEITG